MRYTIMQLPLSDQNIFRRWNDIPAEKKPRPENYVSVWTDKGASAISDNVFLEHLFTKFNVEPPIGYAGHSLSVSDVIEIKHKDKEPRYLYCDSFGWKDVTAEFKRKV